MTRDIMCRVVEVIQNFKPVLGSWQSWCSRIRRRILRCKLHALTPPLTLWRPLLP